MQGPVSWEALLLLVSLTIAVNATTAIFVGWLVYKLCVIAGEFERRIMRLEMRAERGGRQEGR